MGEKRDKTLAELAFTIADHQARVEKLGVKWGALLTEKLDAAEKRLLDEITGYMETHRRGLSSLKSLTDLHRLEKKIAAIRKEAFAQAQKEIMSEAGELADNEQKWAGKLTETLDPESSDKLSFVNKKTLNDGIGKQLIESRTAEEWFSGTASADVMRINDMVREGVRSGWTIPEMTRRIVGTKANNYTDGILETSRRHAESMARTICSGIANNAKDQFYQENDDVVIGVEWLDTLDSRTCARCGGLSRKRWKTKEPHPVPPAHHNCYDDQTRVMTNQGLKYFRDLDGSELFFSFNPETEDLEFIPAIRHIRYTVNENLIHFQNHRFDLMVTKNHRMFGYRYAKGCIAGYKFYDAENMPNWDYRIPSGAKWTGRKSPITPRRIAWLRFMAFWLADGSVTKRSDNHYQIKISQENNGWMRDALKDFPYPLGNQDTCLMFSDKKLGEYLSRFGHAKNKYIPEDIKNSSPEEIKIFLQAFSQTDGRVAPGKFWKGYQFNPSVQYFTSSERMRDDLCELILKAGGRPSVSANRTKGTVQKFRNGEYTINGDCFIIHHLKQTGTTVETLTREETPYSGEVFCVELERNHTLYVERNGKFCWCGNCRCVLIPVTELTDLGDDAFRPAANADFDAEAKELYEKKYPGKKYEDLAPSTRKKYFYEAQHAYTARTGNPPYRQAPGGMTFTEYFEQMPEDDKKRYLGPGKYEVYKNGNLPITKFFPPYPERMYSVKELKEMDKKRLVRFGDKKSQKQQHNFTDFSNDPAMIITESGINAQRLNTTNGKNQWEIIPDEVKKVLEHEKVRHIPKTFMLKDNPDQYGFVEVSGGVVKSWNVAHNNPHGALTAVHETGHLVDEIFLTSSQRKRILDIVKSSEEYQEMMHKREILLSAKKLSSKNKDMLNDLNLLLSDKELLARSFTEFEANINQGALLEQLQKDAILSNGTIKYFPSVAGEIKKAYTEILSEVGL